MIYMSYKVNPEKLKWRRCFAWLPVTVDMDKFGNREKAWLEWVWCRNVIERWDGVISTQTEYRLEKPENEKEHSWDTYTIPPCSP